MFCQGAHPRGEKEKNLDECRKKVQVRVIPCSVTTKQMARQSAGAAQNSVAGIQGVGIGDSQSV